MFDKLQYFLSKVPNIHNVFTRILLTSRNNNPWGPRRTSQGNIDQIFRNYQDQFKKAVNTGKKNPLDPRFIKIAIGLLLLFWISSGFYVVNEGEQGIIQRFGQYTRTTYPGLNYHLPFPIEKESIVNVQLTNTVEIGYRSSGSSQRDIKEESLMLSRDENIVDINFEVQWNIKDAVAYLFNVRDLQGDSTVKSAAESAMREVISSTPYTFAIEGAGRAQSAVQTKKRLQDIVDMYGYGINIHSIQIKKVDPPAQVIAAFRDVQTARADMEKEINQAEAYRNDILPRARGSAERLIQNAEAFKLQAIARATGESQRFLQVETQYHNSPSVTKKRLYLDTLEGVLKDTEKIIIDQKSSGVLPYLPLQGMQKHRETMTKQKVEP